MFDPMIYSQELLHKQQQLDQYLQLQRAGGGEEGLVDLEGGSTADSPSTGQAPDVLSAAVIFRRDEHDSASRKTSTASDYTFSSSDYTPENTIVDGLDDQQQPLPVQEIILVQSPQAVNATPSSGVQQPQQTTGQPDSPQSEPKTTPQRKISRFYVSPVNLNIPQQQIITMDTNKTIQQTAEGPAEVSVKTMEIKVVSQSDNVGVVPAATKEGESIGVMADGQGDPQINIAQSQSARTSAGPEQMNTLEQLKIGLENITHAHVNAAQQQQAGVPAPSSTSSGQVTNVGPKLSSVVPPPQQNLVASHPPPLSVCATASGGNLVSIDMSSVHGGVVLSGTGGGNVSVGLVNVLPSNVNPGVLPSVVSASSTATNPQQVHQQLPTNVILVDGGCVPVANMSSSVSHHIGTQQQSSSQLPNMVLVPSVVNVPQPIVVPQNSVVGMHLQQQSFSSAPNVMNVVAHPSSSSTSSLSSNVVYSNQVHFQQFPPGLVQSQQLIQQQPGTLVQEVKPMGQQQQNSGTNNSSNNASQTSSVMHSRRTSADVLTSTLLDPAHHHGSNVGTMVTDGGHHPISADQVRAIRKHSSEERSMSL